jgi:hypothetical protein
VQIFLDNLSAASLRLAFSAREKTTARQSFAGSPTTEPSPHYTPRRSRFLSQYFTLALDFEKIFFAPTLKIVLQQNRHEV